MLFDSYSSSKLVILSLMWVHQQKHNYVMDFSSNLFHGDRHISLSINVASDNLLTSKTLSSNLRLSIFLHYSVQGITRVQMQLGRRPQWCIINIWTEKYPLMLNYVWIAWMYTCSLNICSIVLDTLCKLMSFQVQMKLKMKWSSANHLSADCQKSQ